MGMNKTQEALTLALEALEYHTHEAQRIGRTAVAINAIREALVEQDEYGGEFVEVTEQPSCKYPHCPYPCPDLPDCRDAEQPAQQPVAYMDICEKGQMSDLRFWSEPDNRHEVPLYTSPQPRGEATLAQQREPVAWVNQANLISASIQRNRGGQGDTHTWSETPSAYHPIPLYTSPQPSKPFVGLTDEEYREIYQQDELADNTDPWNYERSIEAKLREKNSITGESK